MGFLRVVKTPLVLKKVAKSAGFLFFILGLIYALFNVNLVEAKNINLGNPGDQILINGNIGVGIANPLSSLHFYGTTATTTEFLKFTSADGGDIRFGKDSGVDNDAIIGTWTNNDLLFYTNSANSMILKAGGGLGVGTTNPGTGNILNVKGLTPTVITGYGNATGNMGQLVLESSDAYTTQNGGRIAFSGNAGTNGGAFAGQTRQDSVFGIIEGFKSNATANNAGGGLIFKTNYNPDGHIYERMRITDNGNVGIGTSNPGNLLQVRGALTTEGTSVDVARFDGGTTVPAGSLIFTSYYSNATRLAGIQSKDRDNNARGLLLNPAGGNVGIGTATAPGATLDIAGATASLRANSATLSNIGSGIIMADASGNLYSTSTSVASGIPSPTGITGQTLRSNGTSWVANNLLYVNGTNVGIGTTNPLAKLDVAGGIRQFGYNVSDAATDNLLVNGDFEMNDKYGWNTGSVVTGGYSGNYTLQITGSTNLNNDDYIPVDPTKDVFQLDAWVKKSVAGATPGVIYFGYYAYDANKTIITSSPCGTYCYFAASGYNLPADGNWHKLSATTVGEGTVYPNFPVGTKYVRVMGLINYGASADAVTLVDHVTLKRLPKGPVIVGNNFYGSNMNDQNQFSKIFTTAANNLVFELPVATGNVGIGTTNPGATLDVRGTVASFRANSATLSNIGAGLIMADASGNLYSTTTAAATGIPSPSGISGQTLRSNGTSWVANNLLYNNGTNVGVGTTALGAKLTIRSGLNGWAVNTGTVQTNGAFRVEGGNNAVLDFGVNSSSGSWIQSTDKTGLGTSYPLILQPNGGNIGVGTITPSTPLHVQGPVYAAGSYPFNIIANDTAAAGINVGGGIGLGGKYSGSNYAWFGGIHGGKENATADYLGYLSFVTNNGSAMPERMRIDSSGDIGIGTTNPVNKLHLAEASQTDLYGVDSASPVSNLMLQGTDTTRVVGKGPSMLFSFPANTDGSNVWAQARILATPDNNSNGNAIGRLYLQVRDSYNPGTGGSWNWRTGLLIAGNGNVGVNSTSTPGTTLDVGGTIGSFRAKSGTLSNIGSGIIMADASGNLYSTSSLAAISAGWTVNGTTVYKTDTNGNVGVGTTNPTLGKLQVNGNVIIDGSNGLFGYNGGGTHIYSFTRQDGVQNASLSISGYGGIGFTGGKSAPETTNYQMFLNSSGNLGIGTTAPIGPLEIYKSASANTAQDIFIGSSIAGYPNFVTKLQVQRFGQFGQGWNFLVANDSAGAVSEAMRINSEGNVGIGTTNPSEKLEINGISKAQNGDEVGYRPFTQFYMYDTVLHNYWNRVFRLTPTTANITFQVLIKDDRNYADYGLYIVQATKYSDTNFSLEVDRIAGNNTDPFYATIDASGYVWIKGTGAWSYFAGYKVLQNAGADILSGAAILTQEATPEATMETTPSTYKKAALSGGVFTVNPSFTGFSDIVRGTTGNIGIATTNPGTTLDVGGTTGSFRAKSGTLSNIGSGIIMADASGNLYSTSSLAAITAGWTVNGNDVYKTNLTGNVGIGMVNPLVKLSVVGQDVNMFSGTASNTFLMGRSATENLSLIVDDTGATFESVQDENTPGFGNMIFKVDSDGTADGFFNFQNKAGTSFMRINSAGNVGIGTTNPGEKLSVNGSIGYAAGSSLYPRTGVSDWYLGQFTGISTIDNSLGTSPAAQQFRIGVQSSGAFVSNVALNAGNGNSYIATGNVGIGTTNPLAKLQVNGAVSLNADSVYNNREILTISRAIATGAGSWVNLGSMVSNGQGSYINIYQSNHHSGTINAAVYEISDVYYSGVTTDWMQVPTSNYRSYSGVQDYAIDVRRTANHGTANLEIRARALSNTPGAGTLQFEIQTNGTFIADSTSGSGATVSGYLSRNAYQFPVSNDRFKASSDGLFILNSGYVGIGTTNPGTTLDVAGSVGSLRAKSATISNLTNGIIMGDASGNLYATSSSIASGVPSPSGIAGQTLRSDGTNWVANSILYNNGTYIGIGTTTPQNKLQIGTTGYTGNDFVVGNANGSVAINNNSGNSYVWGSQRLDLLASGNGISIALGGNVGIGTTTPSTIFHISSNSADIKLSNPSNPTQYYTTINSDYSYAHSFSLINMAGGVSKEILGVYSNNTYMDGNVGIGTTAPGTSKLYVNGATYLNGATTVNGIATVNSGLELATSGTKSVSYYGALAGGYFTQMQTTVTAGFGTYGPVTSDWALYNRFSGANTRGWVWQLGTTNVAALSGQGHMKIAGNLESLGSVNASAFNGGVSTAGSGNNILFADNNGTINRSDMLSNTNDTELGINGGIIYKRTAKADVAYTASSTDYIIAFTSLSADRVLTLPTCDAAANGRTYVITNEASGANKVVITPSGGATIIGTSTLALYSTWSTPVYCNGNNSWFIY